MKKKNKKNISLPRMFVNFKWRTSDVREYTQKLHMFYRVSALEWNHMSVCVRENEMNDI